MICCVLGAGELRAERGGRAGVVSPSHIIVMQQREVVDKFDRVQPSRKSSHNYSAPCGQRSLPSRTIVVRAFLFFSDKNHRPRLNDLPRRSNSWGGEKSQKDMTIWISISRYDLMSPVDGPVDTRLIKRSKGGVTSGIIIALCFYCRQVALGVYLIASLQACFKIPSIIKALLNAKQSRLKAQ